MVSYCFMACRSQTISELKYQLLVWHGLPKVMGVVGWFPSEGRSLMTLQNSDVFLFDSLDSNTNELEPLKHLHFATWLKLIFSFKWKLDMILSNCYAWQCLNFDENKLSSCSFGTSWYGWHRILKAITKPLSLNPKWIKFITFIDFVTTKQQTDTNTKAPFI